MDIGRPLVLRHVESKLHLRVGNHGFGPLVQRLSRQVNHSLTGVSRFLPSEFMFQRAVSFIACASDTLINAVEEDNDDLMAVDMTNESNIIVHRNILEVGLT